MVYLLCQLRPHDEFHPVATAEYHVQANILKAEYTIQGGTGIFALSSLYWRKTTTKLQKLFACIDSC